MVLEPVNHQHNCSLVFCTGAIIAVNYLNESCSFHCNRDLANIVAFKSQYHVQFTCETNVLKNSKLSLPFRNRVTKVSRKIVEFLSIVCIRNALTRATKTQSFKRTAKNKIPYPQKINHCSLSQSD